LRDLRFVVLVTGLLLGSASVASAQAAADSAAADTSGFESATSDTAFGPQDDSSFGDFSVPEEGEGPIGGSVRYFPHIHYNRVDQWALGVNFGCQPGAGWYPRFDVDVALALGRDHRGLYSLEVAQPIFPERKLLLGLEQRRLTDHEDEERVGTIENFLAAFLFHYDYRDYFEREGTSAFLEAYPIVPVSARVTYSDHDYTSITDIAPGTKGVFRRGAEWRANPAIDEGRMKSVWGYVAFDARDNPLLPRHGAWARLGFESTGPHLDSDFTYTRYELELRGYFAVTHGIGLKTRTLLGTTTAGTLPLQKEFAVGGISTLRAHNYKTRRGNQEFLANVEGSIQVWRGRQRSSIRTNVKVLAFLDVGQAWNATSYTLASQKMLADGGLGLSVADGRLQGYAAHDLQNSKAGVLWTLRLSSPF